MLVLPHALRNMKLGSKRLEFIRSMDMHLVMIGLWCLLCLWITMRKNNQLITAIVRERGIVTVRNQNRKPTNWLSLLTMMYPSAMRHTFLSPAPRDTASSNIWLHAIELYWDNWSKSQLKVDIKGSVCQDWVVDWAPAALQKGLKGGVVSTPLPIKLLSLVPPSRHLDSNQKGGCVCIVNAATRGLGTSVC